MRLINKCLGLEKPQVSGAWAGLWFSSLRMATGPRLVSSVDQGSASERLVLTATFGASVLFSPLNIRENMIDLIQLI